ncbi:MAG: DUF3999 family protein [Polyangiales bacterium]
MRLTIVLVTLLWCARVHALAPEELVRGVVVEIEKPGAIQAYTLPADVLRILVDPDFGDLCAFDADGKQLAQAVAIPEEKAELADVTLPFFPLEARARDAAGVSVSVERSADGVITRAFSAPLYADQKRVVGYLLDTGADDAALEALTLGIDAAEPYTVEVRVEASDDLTSFRPVATTTLARLEHEGRTLKRDVVTFPAVRSPYLRIGFAKAPESLVLREVTARVQRAAALRARHVIELPALPIEDADADVFQYRLSGAFTPDRYRVLLPASTSLIDATLESAARPEGPFSALDHGIFRPDDGVVRDLPRTDDRVFRLRVARKGGGLHGGRPVLQLGYLAPRLLFHAEGRAPYLIAYGSARARCKQFNRAELTSITSDPVPEDDTVRIAQRRELGGEAVLREERALPVRTYVLWGVLLVAVALLGLLARKLLRAL